MEKWKVEAEAASSFCMCQRASCTQQRPTERLCLKWWKLQSECKVSSNYDIHFLKNILHSHLKWVDVSSHIHKEINYFIKYFLISLASCPLPATTTFSFSLSKSSFDNRHWQNTDKIKHMYSLDSIVKIEIQVTDYNVCTFNVFNSMIFQVYTHTRTHMYIYI